MDADIDTLTSQELEDYEYYQQLMVDCPNCKNKDNVRVHVIGRPSSSLINIAKKTKRIILSGCCVNGESKKFSCAKCDAKFNK
jgi:hypothetical protein